LIFLPLAETIGILIGSIENSKVVDIHKVKKSFFIILTPKNIFLYDIILLIRINQKEDLCNLHI